MEQSNNELNKSNQSNQSNESNTNNEKKITIIGQNNRYQMKKVMKEEKKHYIIKITSK